MCQVHDESEYIGHIQDIRMKAVLKPWMGRGTKWVLECIVGIGLKESVMFCLAQESAVTISAIPCDTFS